MHHPPTVEPAISQTPVKTVTSEEENTLKELESKLEHLRGNYTGLQREFIQLNAECEDMDTLLKDMRAALFNLRIGIQQFDDYEVQPLNETTMALNELKNRLQQYSNEAEGN